MNTLSQQEIISALEDLSLRLEKENIRGEICIFGGAAMVLAFQARQSTKDIDAIFAPATRIREIALQIGSERNWELK